MSRTAVSISRSVASEASTRFAEVPVGFVDQVGEVGAGNW
jgi:hypothetical protein